MTNKAAILLLIGLCSSVFSTAQEVTLKEVIDKVLQNNFEVQLGRQDLNMATNNNTKGNAGLLPSVQLNTGANYSNNNTEIKFAGTIPPTNVKGAQNTSYNASVGASYTAFNGFANLRTYDKLQVLEDLSEQQLRLTLENAIITSIGLYMDLAKIQDDRSALMENLRLSTLRLNRMELARKLGTSTSLDLLNAQMDYQTDSITVLSVENQMGAMQRQLNYLMGTEINTTISAKTDPSDLQLLLLDDVLILAKSNSTQLIMAELRKQSAELDKEIAKGVTMPLVNLTSSYGYTSSQNAAGIVLQQSNLGLSSGINISIPIFSGGKIKTALENAQINMDKSALDKQQNTLSVEKEVYDHWYNYQHQLKLEILEKQNLDMAQKVEERSAQSYKLGQITSLEYRQAQLNLLSTQNRLSAARFSARKEMYHLLRLQGKLINSQE